MDQASWNSWHFLFFIGEEMFSLRQLENHTLQEFPTDIFKEENKGLYFLDLYILDIWS